MTDRPGGGVAIYVKTGLNCVRRSDLISGDLEALCVEIIPKNISSFYVAFIDHQTRLMHIGT